MGYCDTRCTKLFGKPKLTNPILPNFIRRFSGFVNFCCRISFGSGNIFRPYPQITYFSGGVDSWEGFDCWVSLMNGPIFLSTNRFRCLALGYRARRKLVYFSTRKTDGREIESKVSSEKWKPLTHASDSLFGRRRRVGRSGRGVWTRPRAATARPRRACRTLVPPLVSIKWRHQAMIFFGSSPLGPRRRIKELFRGGKLCI